jgi:tol-pal system protein YbgF
MRRKLAFVRGVLPALALLLLSAAAPPSRAQLFQLEDEAARDAIVRLDGEVAAIKTALRDISALLDSRSAALGELEIKYQNLEERLRALTGALEELGHDLSSERKSAAQAAAGLAERETRIDERLAAFADELRELRALADVPDEREMYDAAVADYQRGDYRAALVGFQSLLRTYPEGRFAASARYRIGGSHFALGEYDEAIAAQRELIDKYPASDKVPEAAFGVAEAQAAMGDGDSARATLQDILARYPTSLAADKARERLNAPQ